MLGCAKQTSTTTIWVHETAGLRCYRPMTSASSQMICQYDCNRSSRSLSAFMGSIAAVKSLKLESAHAQDCSA